MAHVEQLPSGRFRGIYRDPAGNRRKRSFDERSEAGDWAKVEEGKVIGNTWRDPATGDDLFGPWAERWHVSYSQRQSTRAGSRAVLDTVVLPQWSASPLRTLTTSSLQAWVDEMTAGTHKRVATTRPRPLRPSTVQNYYGIAMKILRFAYERDAILTLPRSPRLPKEDSESKMRFLSKRELEKLALATPDGFGDLILLLGMTGIRIGEALALKRSDVNVADPERGTISITKTLATANGRLIINAPKTKRSVRSIALSPGLVTALTPRLDRLSQTDIVFPGPGRSRSEDSRYMAPSNFRHRPFAKALEATGLGPLRVHDLRHTAVTLCLEAGYDVKTLATEMGHSSVKTILDRYAHVVPNRNHHLAAKFDDL